MAVCDGNDVRRDQGELLEHKDVEAVVAATPGRWREKTAAIEEQACGAAMACFPGNQAYQTKSRVVRHPRLDLRA